MIRVYFPGDAVCAARQHAAAGDGAAGCYHNVTVQRGRRPHHHFIYFRAVPLFLLLSGLDTGSPFAGIGASRELTLGVLVEPILFLGLLVVALIAGSTNIGSISAVMSQGWVSPTATFLAMLACGFATFIEMGKIPFDVAEAEQELQEGPLTEYSGSGLALVKWGSV